MSINPEEMLDMFDWGWFVAWGIAWTILGYKIDGARGAISGFILGPLGCILVYATRTEKPRCSHCSQPAPPRGKACPHCGTVFGAPPISRITSTSASGKKYRLKSKGHSQPQGDTADSCYLACPHCKKQVIVLDREIVVKNCPACGGVLK